MRRDHRRVLEKGKNRDRRGVKMGRIGDHPFDELKGPRVLVKFRRETDRKEAVSGTGRHRGFRSVFEGNVECLLEYPIYRTVHKL